MEEEKSASFDLEKFLVDEETMKDFIKSKEKFQQFLMENPRPLWIAYLRASLGKYKKALEQGQSYKEAFMAGWEILQDDSLCLADDLFCSYFYDEFFLGDSNPIFCKYMIEKRKEGLDKGMSYEDALKFGLGDILTLDGIIPSLTLTIEEIFKLPYNVSYDNSPSIADEFAHKQKFKLPFTIQYPPVGIINSLLTSRMKESSELRKLSEKKVEVTTKKRERIEPDEDVATEEGCRKQYKKNHSNHPQFSNFILNYGINKRNHSLKEEKTTPLEAYYIGDETIFECLEIASETAANSLQLKRQMGK